MSTQNGDKEYTRSMQGLALQTVLSAILAFGKLTGTWASLSWIWVFSPFWMPYALMAGALILFFTLLALALLMGGFFGLLSVIDDYRRKK